MGVLLGGKSGSPSNLLTAFVLSICFFSTEALWKRTNITVEPPNVVDGGKVDLIPITYPPIPVICRWYRGEMYPNNTVFTFYYYPTPGSWNGVAFTGRERMKDNCTLEIIDLNINDTANYSVVIEGPRETRFGTVELVIQVPPSFEPGRGFSRSTVAGIILGCLGLMVVLGVAVFAMKRSSRPEIRTIAPAVTTEETEEDPRTVSKRGFLAV
nr:carcinoembryonic antigen-related cell adhesion molecule 6-like [Anolis sagrei ordinatus]